MKLTILIPMYNEQETIGILYGELNKVSHKLSSYDMEFVFVDDGSSDHTAELVRSWQAQDNGFEIQYIYKNNGGMHTAHNTAYENIHTELNVCIDSDDCLADGAIKKILEKWESIKEAGYAGIIGLDADLETVLQGNIEKLRARYPQGFDTEKSIHR